jgi:hypothetical protein
MLDRRIVGTSLELEQDFPAMAFREPPRLETILESLKTDALRVLARKVGAGTGRSKDELVAAIRSSKARRKTILEQLKQVELVEICKRFGIPATAATAKSRLVLRLGWRVFIVHRGSVLAAASKLRAGLSAHEPIFLDSESLRAAAPWPREILDALNSAVGYVVMISDDFESPWIADEVIRIVDSVKRRRVSVCPLFLGGVPRTLDDVPYGLAGFQPLDGTDLAAAAIKIAEEFAALPR